MVSQTTKTSKAKKVITKALVDKEMTFKELATGIKVTPEWLSKVINGHNPGLPVRHAVCRYLGLPYEEVWD